MGAKAIKAMGGGKTAPTGGKTRKSSGKARL
jgi:hypothetical protein